MDHLDALKRFEIVEIDRDYHTVSGIEYMDFPSKAAADAYCKRESWTGYRYFAKEVLALEP